MSIEEHTQLLDLAHDAILVRDLATDEIQFWNRGAEHTYGWSRQEALGRVSHELLRTRFPRPLPEIQAQLAQAGHWEGELVQMRRDDAEIVVVSRWALEREAGGGPRRTLEINSEITERKRAEEALRQSQERFRSLIEHALDLIVVLDAAGSIQFGSPSVRRTLGYQPEEYLGKSFLEFVHPEDAPLVMNSFTRRLQAAEAGSYVQFRVRRRDGSWRTLEAIGRAMGRPPGADGVVVNARDVTERMHLQHRREALIRAGRRFAAEADTEQVLDDLAEEAVAALEGDGTLIARWDAQRQVLLPVRNSVPMMGAWRATRLGLGVSGQAAQRRAPVIVNNYQTADSMVPAAVAAGIRAGVGVPLLHEGQLLGTLAVFSHREGRAFTPEDAETLELLAGIGAASLVGLGRSRLAGVLLAARTAEHELNNQLAGVSAYVQRLSRDPALPPRLREQALIAIRRANDAAATVRQLQHLTELVETNWGPGSGPTIDLLRSGGLPDPAAVSLDTSPEDR